VVGRWLIVGRRFGSVHTGQAEETPCITDACVIEAIKDSPRLRNTLRSEHVVQIPIGRKSKVRNKMEIITLQQVEGGGGGVQISNLFFQ